MSNKPSGFGFIMALFAFVCFVVAAIDAKDTFIDEEEIEVGTNHAGNSLDPGSILSFSAFEGNRFSWVGNWRCRCCLGQWSVRDLHVCWSFPF